MPPLSARVEGFVSRFAGRVGVRNGGDGFWPGVGLGLSLGVLYAPCAGPILAGVLTFSASQSFNAERLAVVLAYAIGSALVLYLLMLGGRKLTAPLARRSGAFQMAMGAIMVLVAFAMCQGYDNSFQFRYRQRSAGIPGQAGGRHRKEPRGAAGAGRNPRRRKPGPWLARDQSGGSRR